MRIGVDTGGTFTDCVIFEGSEVRVFKLFSTPDDPARGITEGVAALAGASVHPAEAAAVEIIHGTTVGTNSLLERRGARVALVTTAGFEDLIDIGRQARPQLYDLDVRREPSLVPRPMRFGVRERTVAGGNALLRPSAFELARLRRRIAASGAESIALCFLFSYANPDHERAAARALRGLGLPISISHEILPEFREYERVSTVVINAYLAPRLGAYLARLEAAFGDRKPPTRVFVMQSSGGITTAARAAREPVHTLLSGPAGGVMATAWLARQLGLDRAISFDMGGTSTDVCLLDGPPRTTRETTLGGLPVAVPVLDIHSVGAGGGSLARLDAGGALRVGPESAGAQPGPACYGRGGVRPTVTDADLLLGRLDPDYFLGGTFRLDLAAARQAFTELMRQSRRPAAFDRAPATALGLARGIVAVANATMERALRLISVERGHDPRDFSLVSFGGAGGLHAAALARSLGVEQVIVPRNPGAFSALGILLSDIVRDVSQSVLLPVPSPIESSKSGIRSSGGWFDDLNRRFGTLERAARDQLRREGFDGAVARAERRLDVRYAGQSYELPVPFNRDFVRRFHADHEQAYGHAQAGHALEIVNLRLRLVIETPKFGTGNSKVENRKSTAGIGNRKKRARESAGRAVVRQKQVWFDNRLWKTPVYDRERLQAGARLTGPAVVVEYSSTTLVPPDFECRVDEFLNLIISRRERPR
ncbi:MAG TPA: hydantoinase/oxoprolinase family protein [Terriglobia bacterium]|nr:hydantoinase/oxoprolinase family protein [Terriglobia bacterium]